MKTDYIMIFQKYMGTGLVLILFFAAVMYLFFTEKRKGVRALFIYLPVAILLLYFNPLFFNLFYAVVGGEIYFRILWLLPITWVLAYTGVVLYKRMREEWKLPGVVLLLLLPMVCGKLVYTSPLFTPAENIYHVPDEVVEICDAIRVEGREVMAVFPKEFLLYVRQYSGTVCMPYGRDGIQYQSHPLYKLMESSMIIEAEELAGNAREELCHYIICHQDKEFEGSLLDYEYELFGQVGEYFIYRDTTLYIGL